MKKQELVAAAAKIAGVSQEVARQVLNGAQQAVHEAMAKGEKEIYAFGLGKLIVKHRKAKPARHMRTGERVLVPARNVITYTPSVYALSVVNP